jgi:integrase/recombinase XerD
MPWLEDLPTMVAKPLHRLSRSGVSAPQAASLDEYVAMMAVAGTVRDRLLITVLALTGLRIGQTLGLRRSHMQLIANSPAVGCSCPGSPAHVVRRERNENLVAASSAGR